MSYIFILFYSSFTYIKILLMVFTLLVHKIHHRILFKVGSTCIAKLQSLKICWHQFVFCLILDRYFRFCINNCFPREFLDFIRLPKLSRAQRNHCTMLYVNEIDRAGNGVNMSVHMHVYMSARVWEPGCRDVNGWRTTEGSTWVRMGSVYCPVLDRASPFR